MAIALPSDTDLLRLFAEKEIALMLAPPERILLRDEDGRPLEYDDTEQTRRWRRRLEAFNEAASALTVSLDGRIIREGEPLVTPKNRIGASTVTMFRVFNRTFKMGGRFYGPWVQNVEKELRGTIEINGYPTDEPDYPEHHARLLYDILDRQMPAEPFSLDGYDRSTVKPAFYTLLNAETPIAARRSIAEEIMGRGREGYAKASKLIAEIERKHSAIADQFGRGAGLWLMRKDSEITERILGRLLRGGDFALPIHDSYLVPYQTAERTREIMAEELEKSTKKSTTASTRISSDQVVEPTSESTQPLPQNGGGGSRGQASPSAEPLWFEVPDDAFPLPDGVAGVLVAIYPAPKSAPSGNGVTAGCRRPIVGYAQ